MCLVSRRRRVYEGSCKTSPSRRFPTVKIGGSLARNARFDVPTSLVLSLWFSCCLAVSMGENAKPLLFECFQAGCHVVFEAICDIPTCLTTCRKFQNWRKSRTKCSFCCAHVSCLESLVFLWRRRVFGGSCTTSPFRRFSSRLPCRFEGQAWRFVTFQPVLYRVENSFVWLAPQGTPHSTL